MAKKASPTATTPVPIPQVHLSDLLNEYNQFGKQHLRDILKMTGDRKQLQSMPPYDYFFQLGTGLHFTNAIRAKTKWLQFCVCAQSGTKGKPRNSHQKCISTTSIQAFANEAVKQGLLNKSYNTFEDVYDDIFNISKTLNKTAKNGNHLGDLFIYDVSLRFAYNIGITPKKYVYLHAGPLEAAEKLEKLGLISLKPNLQALPWKNGYHRVCTTVFSNLFPAMESMDIENFLCIAKAYFMPQLIIP